MDSIASQQAHVFGSEAYRFAGQMHVPVKIHIRHIAGSFSTGGSPNGMNNLKQHILQLTRDHNVSQQGLEWLCDECDCARLGSEGHGEAQRLC